MKPPYNAVMLTWKLKYQLHCLGDTMVYDYTLWTVYVQQ